MANNRHTIRFFLPSINFGCFVLISYAFMFILLFFKDSHFYDLWQVVVQQLNFVERSASPMASYDDSGNLLPGNDLFSRSYHLLLCKQLCCFRLRLSLSKDLLKTLSGKRRGYQAANSTGSTQELWQAFFADPLEWWDNRRNKVLFLT